MRGAGHDKQATLENRSVYSNKCDNHANKTNHLELKGASQMGIGMPCALIAEHAHANKDAYKTWRRDWWRVHGQRRWR
eukprot:9316088-Pyramimonas_sp.AAC.1